MPRFAPLCHVLGLLALAYPAAAQLGVSPNDNLNFLDDLRARSAGEAPQPIPEGERQAVDRGHELARPDPLSTIQTQMQIFQGDFSGYRGVYATDWDYLSPWHDGMVTPQRMHETRDGLRWGAAFEQSIEYNRYRIDPLPVFAALGFNQEDFIPRSRLFLSAEYGNVEEGRWTLNFAGGLAGTFSQNFAFTCLGNRFALEILPGSALAYDVVLGDFALTLYDRVSLRPVSFVYRYVPPRFQSIAPIFQNDLGAGVVWRDGGRLSAGLNYNWSRSIDLDDAGFGDRGVQSLSGDLRYQWSPKLTLGVDGSYARVDPMTPRRMTVNSGTWGSSGNGCFRTTTSCGSQRGIRPPSLSPGLCSFHSPDFFHRCLSFIPMATPTRPPVPFAICASPAA